jgi:hypothetical protein
MKLGELAQQQFASPEEALQHFGVKGMHWGVRKDREPIPELRPQLQGVTVRRDGSMDIKRGAELQRLVRSSGKSLPMKDITYASMGDYDNSRYIKSIGGKGFLGGGRDRILSIKATKVIKAPSVEEATRIVSDKMLNDAKFRRKNTDPLGNQISNKELEQIRKDPTGKTAEAWYFHTNQKLTFDKEYDPDAPYIQAQMRETMQGKGYTALRDENDVTAKISKVPIIIFNPQDSLKVVKMTDITDELRKANKAKLKQYEKHGKDWIDKELYGDS